MAMLGMTTAVGGGMLRDTMLGLTPPTALRDPVQALVAIAVSILVFFVWRRRKAELHNRYAETVLLLADSLGLGIFSAHGAAIAIQAGYGANWFLVLFMGMLTGVGGRRAAGCVQRGAALYLHQARVRLRVAGRARRCVCCCGLWVRERP